MFHFKRGLRNWFAYFAHSVGMCILIISFFVKKNMTTKHVVTDEYTNWHFTFVWRALFFLCAKQ